MNNTTLINKLKNVTTKYDLQLIIEALETEEKQKKYCGSDKKALQACKRLIKDALKRPNRLFSVFAPYEFTTQLDHKFFDKTLWCEVNGHCIYGITTKYEGLPYYDELNETQLKERNLDSNDTIGRPFNIFNMLVNDFSEYTPHIISSGDVIAEAKLNKDKPYIVGDRVAGYNPAYLKYAIEILQLDDEFELLIKDRISPAYIVNDKGFAVILPINISKKEEE